MSEDGRDYPRVGDHCQRARCWYQDYEHFAKIAVKRTSTARASMAASIGRFCPVAPQQDTALQSSRRPLTGAADTLTYYFGAWQFGTLKAEVPRSTGIESRPLGDAKFSSRNFAGFLFPGFTLLRGLILPRPAAFTEPVPARFGGSRPKGDIDFLVGFKLISSTHHRLPSQKYVPPSPQKSYVPLKLL